MGNIATLIAMLVCVASGWIAGDWQRQRIAAAEQSELRERAESLSGKLVEAERRITSAEAGRNQTRQQGRTLAAASALADVRLPDDVAELLHAVAKATRAATNPGKAGAATMPGSTAAAMSGGG